MGKGMYKKIMRAGKMETAILYSRATPIDSTETREAKKAVTNKAQKYINIRNSTRKLELLLWANFDNVNTKWCTFTFNSDNYPANMTHAKEIWRAYLKKLGKEMRNQGRPWRYIYTVEGNHRPGEAQEITETAQKWEVEPWEVKGQWEKLGTPAAYELEEKPCRIHFHCFLILREPNCSIVKNLWRYGDVKIKSPSIWEPKTFSRLAHYMTKESRNCIKNTGARSYTPSLGLVQPIETGGWCSDSEQLTLPAGATKIVSGNEDNEAFGTRMEYISYLLPKDEENP